MIYIIFVCGGLIIIYLLLNKKSRQSAVGICATVMDQTVRKNANKEKILALLGEKSEVSNTLIREALGVSERTVVRYMDELERVGRVEQVGKVGQDVTYRLKA